VLRTIEQARAHPVCVNVWGMSKYDVVCWTLYPYKYVRGNGCNYALCTFLGGLSPQVIHLSGTCHLAICLFNEPHRLPQAVQTCVIIYLSLIAQKMAVKMGMWLYAYFAAI
jgi:hypothetical protein